MPISSALALSRSPISSFSDLGIQTIRWIPPSPLTNFLWQVLYLPCPTNPGVLKPPPIVPASVVNFMPQGVSPVYSRLTVIIPLHMGRTAAIHSQQPQVVMGSLTML